jgi:hypothetical protein
MHHYTNFGVDQNYFEQSIESISNIIEEYNSIDKTPPSNYKRLVPINSL